MSATPGQIGPYSLAQVRVAGGDETVRFQADLLCDGALIAIVSNEGTGGANMLRPTREAGGGVVRAFEEYAEGWNRGSRYAGIEDYSRLVDALLEAWAESQPIYDQSLN